MTITVDTSIFVELILDQKKAKQFESLLPHRGRETPRRHDSFCTTCDRVDVSLRDKKLLDFVKNVENSAGLSVYETSVSDEISVALLSEKIGIDFDDAMQYYAAKKSGSTAIASFDRHFEGLDVTRKDPSKF